MVNFPPPECSRILFRAVLQSGWIGGKGRIRWQAFQRWPKDTDGVSLFYSSEAAERELSDPISGMMTVHVGRVKDITDDEISLDVVRDSADHAVITGIPFKRDCDGNAELYGQMIALCRRLAETAARLYDPREETQ